MSIRETRLQLLDQLKLIVIIIVYPWPWSRSGQQARGTRPFRSTLDERRILIARIVSRCFGDVNVCTHAWTTVCKYRQTSNYSSSRVFFFLFNIVQFHLRKFAKTFESQELGSLRKDGNPKVENSENVQIWKSWEAWKLQKLARTWRFRKLWRKLKNLEKAR